MASDQRRSDFTMCAGFIPDPETEFSIFCQDVTRRGVTVRVTISRIPDVEQRWTLKVTDENGAWAVWDELFETDEEAFLAFGAAVGAVGLDGLTAAIH